MDSKGTKTLGISRMQQGDSHYVRSLVIWDGHEKLLPSCVLYTVLKEGDRSFACYTFYGLPGT